MLRRARRRYRNCRTGGSNADLRHRKLRGIIPVEHLGRDFHRIGRVAQVFDHGIVPVGEFERGSETCNRLFGARVRCRLQARQPRCRIKCQQRAGLCRVFAWIDEHQGHHPAEIKNACGALPVHQRVQKDRQQRPARAAHRHIRIAKIPDNRQTRRIGEHLSVARLAGFAAQRLVVQGFAVKANHLRATEPVNETCGDILNHTAGRARGRRAAVGNRLGDHRLRLGPVGGKSRLADLAHAHAVRFNRNRRHAARNAIRIDAQHAFGSSFHHRTDIAKPRPMPTMMTGPAMTYHPKSEFLHEIIARGFMADCTDLQGLDETLRKGTITAYIGYDLTAASLHIGNLVQIMLLRWLQKTGHRPITLMGGGTTKVGDPSGKDEMRRMLSVDQINAHADSIRQVFSRYVTYGGGPTDSPLVNNADWLDGLKYIEFLRDIGKHFTINRLLTFESVKSRLDREQSLSFIEFNYMLLQAYDFLELNRRFGCVLQMGGSDQWGNIVSGADLIRRVERSEAFGLTTPLVTRSDGKKMGKSVDGAVWLNNDMMSPYEFWQWWRNVNDADVGKFLKMFTELPVDECDRLSELAGAEINEAKIMLANEVTALLHGIDAAVAAATTARDVFEKGGIGEDLPTLSLAADEIGAGISVVQLIVRTGLASSGKEAKRLIADGGARLDDQPLSDASLVLDAGALASPVKLSAGKKRHALVVLG